MWKREKTHQKICWILFFSYLLMLTYFMFFSDGFGRSEYTEYHYNLTLFKEIRRVLHLQRAGGNQGVSS